MYDIILMIKNIRGGFMKNGGIDKRIIKTKNSIRKAFLELVRDKEVENISISELTQHAHITRSTFYMYYSSVTDVRDDIEDEILQNLSKIMGEADLAASILNPLPLLSAMAQEIVRYDENNRYILCGRNSGRLLEKLNQRVVDAFMKVLGQAGGDVSRSKYVAAFFSAGICESFKLWYNHQSSLSLEELCQKISNLVRKGLALALAPDADL